MAVYVDYTYMKKDGTIKSGTSTFYKPSKAVRFIYSLIARPNYSYDGFSCDDEDELEERKARLARIRKIRNMRKAKKAEDEEVTEEDEDEIAEKNYNIDLCGYPHEEEEILPPKELIQQYQAKRASLNADIDRILAQITDILGIDITEE